MPKTPAKPQISTRKRPKQARSEVLVNCILEAAIQVLEKEGAARFTTARVAERAGVSVGSIYQYFPNKASILFRLQSDEWKSTGNLLSRILDDTSLSHEVRLRQVVHSFVLSECEEARMRGALADAAPLYRDSPEAVNAKKENEQAFHRFMSTALPELSTQARKIKTDILTRTLSTVGKDFSMEARTKKEIRQFSDAMSDMLCRYLEL
ncbi:Nucleoid occlusion factor SlmA [Thalassocella blandensis]|nr:Nucleoid occlusion factor SlmA [Thalassocella blandensis]